MRHVACSLALAFLLVGVAPCRAVDARYHTLQLADGSHLTFAIVLPQGFSPHRTYPALLALPPGSQDRSMVEEGLRRYWGDDAARRGWLVVSPVAPDGSSFHDGAEAAIPALLAVVRARHHVEGGRFHLAGASRGGLSAFRVARLHPQLFHSLVVLPGGPATADDERRLAPLKELPIRMLVGGRDTEWVVRARRTEERLRPLGGRVQVAVLAGEGHAPASLEGGAVMELLDELRRELLLEGAPAPPATGPEIPVSILPDDLASIEHVLDQFHDAASRADGEAYFSLFAPRAVFLGTDPSERWTLAEFREYARPHFEAGNGWTYVPRERHVTILGDGQAAWFDELLSNEKYGPCRGTGVAVRTGEGWRIARYSLSFAVANEAAEAVVEAARALAGGS